MNNLSIRSESVERIFSYYLDSMFIVNRRYQRKLVWTQEEKASFIDSIYNEFPIPLILLAQDKNKNYEIIDGMQRLNAITSFILGEFPLEIDGEEFYFNLDSMSRSKELKDSGEIQQKVPILDRTISVNISSYPIPVSITEIKSYESIDNVFRRINSGGKHLSRQEIRQAGSLSKFAVLVRSISSQIRGDKSSSDLVDLNDMHKISITNKSLDYGINVDNLFWVKNSIIRREDVRDSKDEELIAEIVAFMLLDDMVGSSTTILDGFYGLNESENHKLRCDELNNKISLYTSEKIEKDFFEVFNTLKNLLESLDIPFNKLIFNNEKKDKIPRYFQIVFFSFYDLIITQNKIPKNLEILSDKLINTGKNINLSSGGGNWSAKEKTNLTNSYIGLISSAFIKKTEKKNNLIYENWSAQFENILNQSSIENSNYDYKVGFFNLHDKSFNNKLLNRCIKTLTAMANKGKDNHGYILVGVADNPLDAKKIRDFTGQNNVMFNDFHITGLNHDLTMSNKNLEDYFNFIIDKIKVQPIETIYKNYILENIKVFNYRNKPVLKLSIKGLNSPASYNDKYYERHGSNTQELSPKGILNLSLKFE